MEIKIRDMDPIIVKKIDQLAKKHHMSRNEYLKRHLSKIAIVQELEETESKYSNLIHVLVDKLEQANDVIENNSVIIEKYIRGHE